MTKIRGYGISPDDPSLPDEVKKRWKLLDVRALERAEAIQKACGDDKLNEFGQRIHSLMRDCRTPTRLRLRELYKVADEMMSYTAGHVACKRGCNHCCYIGVPISPAEADLIASDLGVKRKIVPLRRGPQSVAHAETFSYGYTKPCTFLVNGECSIYEHRPLVCRIHYSVDEDDLLCRLDHPGPVPVPYMDVTPFNVAYVTITSTKMADVREFFPKGNSR